MKKLLAFALPMSLCACASSTISTSTPVELGPQEGLVTFVVMTNKPVNLISLRKNPDSGAGLSIPYTDAGMDVHVLKGEAGEYCLATSSSSNPWPSAKEASERSANARAHDRCYFFLGTLSSASFAAMSRPAVFTSTFLSMARILRPAPM